MIRSTTVAGLITAFALLLTLFAGTAGAANFRWLDYSPARFFHDRDWELLSETADQVLNEAKIGEQTEWKNPETGTHGTLTPIADGTGKAKDCRKLRVTNSAGGISATSLVTLCRQSNGEWKISRRQPVATGQQ